MSAGRGPEAVQGGGVGCCCRGAGENSGARSGLKAKCGQQTQTSGPVSVSNTEDPSLHVGLAPTDVSLPTSGIGRPPRIVPGHHAIRPVILNLLC
jgi:hypothetical protein